MQIVIWENHLHHMDKENIMRFGIASKGFVYVLFGGLTAVSAMGLSGGGSSDSRGALGFLAGGTIGSLLLALTAAGLVAYVFWRFYQAFADSEDKGNDKKGIAKRIGYFSSGAVYAFLAFTAFQILFGNSSGSGGGGSSWLGEALSRRYGQIIVGAVACGYLGKAIYQIYRAYSGNYKKKINEGYLDDKTRKLLVVSGVAGYMARGVVMGIIAFLTFRAAWNSNSNDGGGTGDAFNFLENEFGALILAIIALGLFLYGIFSFFLAKHRRLNVN